MRVGPYEILETLGRGGTGVVYRARSPAGSDVAIKIVAVTDAAKLARFARERRLLGSFTAGEGFVPLLDAHETPQGAYLVMMLVPGGTLRDRLERGPLATQATLALGRTVAAALSIAHARGIVHRDLKPENILFTADGHPLVADLGLAKHFEAGIAGASQSVQLSRSGHFAGTATYMAPEQARDSTHVTAAADVFSLGAVLYECLAGAPPFEGTTTLDVLGKLMEGTFPPLRARRPDVPARLATVIERALAPRVADRFPDARALADALANDDVGEATAGTRRPVLVAALVFVVTASLGLVAALWLLQAKTPGSVVLKPPTPGPATSTPTAAATPAPATPSPSTTAHGARPRVPTAAVQTLIQSSGRKIDAKDFDGAIADLDHALALEPENAGLWGNRGYARCLARDFKGAVSDYDQALELEPTKANMLAARGSARFQLGDTAGALEDATRSIALEPSNGVAWFARGQARERLGDRDEAIADYARFLDLAPRSSEAATVRAMVANLRLRRRHPQDTATPETYRSLLATADAKQREGDLAGAIDDLSRAIEVEPTDTDAWLLRGLLCNRNGEPRRGIADLTHVIELAPQKALAWFHRAGARALLGDAEGSIEDETHALDLDPNLTIAWSLRASGRIALQDFGGAVFDSTRALEIAPDMSSAWRIRSMAREGLGDLDGAIADAEVFLKLDPHSAKAPEVRRRVEALEASRH